MSHVRVTYPALTKAQVVQRLTQAYAGLRRRLPVTKMILYGSYAQGRHTAGSDIDVIVV
jgi:predicted nucleotidyltransferase